MTAWGCNAQSPPKTAKHCLKRSVEPNELVGPIVFLSSEQSSFVTGVTLAVDGGFLIS
ncbi:SDR family oxidoreductase [Pseudomonas syringae]|uniref:SDR family oxidoreductase n=1 Tax=Pseudomonas syringae TaxID=317 RepID=UPI00215A40B5|nr:SDR family oxidoreductase [Pseudomonas syringae]MCR8721574.1 SDR family oxidoreductase [Pseudomonas syringae]